MPIDAAELDFPYVLVPGAYPVWRALEHLTGKGGYSWWYLVVGLGDGQFGAIQFSELGPLGEGKGAEFLSKPLRELVGAGIPEAVLVGRHAMGMAKAKVLAHDSPGRVVIVTDQGACIGVVPSYTRGTLRGKQEFEQLLDALRDSTKTFAEPRETEQSVVAEQRRVHAQIRHDGHPRNTFLAGADNVIRCWISLPEPDVGAVADAAIPTVTLPPEGITLDAVLQWKDQTQQGTLHLPSDRTARSSDCDLKIHVPEGERFVSAAIAFLYRGRIFEFVYVEASVLPAGAVEELRDKVKVRVEVAHRQIVEVADSNKVDTAMIWGEDRTRVEGPDSQGPTALQTYRSTSGVSFDLRDPDAIIDYLNTELFVAQTSLVRQREKQGQKEEILDAKASDVLHIFRTLARHGAALYNSLDDDLKDPGQRIQVQNISSKEYCPAEFVYDRGWPADDATICPEGLAALESEADDCPHCPSAADLPPDLRIKNPLICPFGFWSLQKIIERRDVVPHAVDVAGGQSFPLPDRRHLPPIDSVLFASSDNVPLEERNITWQSLEHLLPHAEWAPSWTKWRQSVESRLPSLLLALPHHGVEGGEDYLEVGDEQLPRSERLLFRGQLIKEFVNPHCREPGPIVLLLGCRTDAPADLGYIGLARRFQQLHVSIVVGTLAKVLGRHAAPVAREIVAQLASDDDGDTDFGTIMRRVRRRMLARGYLMALCLVALGDAEWRLSPRS